jgi:hypothetical protein
MNCRHQHITPVYDYTNQEAKQIVAQCCDCPTRFTKAQAATQLGLHITTHLTAPMVFTINAAHSSAKPTPPSTTLH